MVTVLLTNYKREENLPLIIEALRSQTIPCKIFLWNNAEKPYINTDVDLIINSSKNLKCWPRWGMVGHTDTEYVMTHDDDWCFEGNDALELLIKAHQENYIPGRAVGFNGVQLGSDKSYYRSENQKKLRKFGIKTGAQHVKFPKKSTVVDVVKGRLIFCKREDLRNLPLYVDFGEDCDDIIVSGFLAGGKAKKHLITHCLNDKIKELPGGVDEMALSQKEGWEDHRSEVSKRNFC